jgi:hypothetical protein
MLVLEETFRRQCQGGSPAALHEPWDALGRKA